MSDSSPSAPAQQTPARVQGTTPPSVLMYLAGFIVTACGLYAVSLALADEHFAVLTLAMTVIGFVVSYLVCYEGIRTGPIEAVAALLFAVICLSLLSGGPGGTGMLGSSMAGDSARSIAMVLAWLAVLRSYTLTSNLRLLFACVPTIAMIGLVGTLVTEPALVTVFAVFIVAACLMIVHDSFQRARPRPAAHHGADRRFSMLGSQLQLALLCSISAALLAHIVAIPLNEIGSALLPPGTIALPTNVHTGTSTSANPQETFAEPPQVRIATGPVHLSEQVVMRVRAEHGAYWRGTSFDEYTGHGWRNNLGAESAIHGRTPQFNPYEGTSGPQSGSSFDQRLFDIPVTDVNGVGTQHHRLHQTVTIEGRGLFHVVYAASEARLVRAAQMIVRADNAGDVYVSDMIPCTTYTAESDVPDASPEQLRTDNGNIPDTIRNIYLDLGPISPDVLSRIRETAARVTAGANTNYDRVKALESWIGNTCRYNVNAAPAPADVDVVDHFLFISKEGYCDSFAAALAIMCRSIGIPSRVASGFAPGDFDTRNQEYLIREKHKHQWTEVFFPHSGWITFDATSESQDVSDAHKKDSITTKGVLGFLLSRGWLPPLALGIVLCMLAYVIKVELLDRVHLRSAHLAGLDLPDTNSSIVAIYEATCTSLSKAGIARSPAQTPNEFLRSAQETLSVFPDAFAALVALTNLVSQWRYSGAIAPQDDVSAATAAQEQIRKEIRAIRKGRTQRVPAIAPGSN